MRSHEVVILVNQSTKDAKDAMFPLLHFVFVSLLVWYLAITITSCSQTPCANGFNSSDDYKQKTRVLASACSLFVAFHSHSK